MQNANLLYTLRRGIRSECMESRHRIINLYVLQSWGRSRPRIHRYDRRPRKVYTATLLIFQYLLTCNFHYSSSVTFIILPCGDFILMKKCTICLCSSVLHSWFLTLLVARSFFPLVPRICFFLTLLSGPSRVIAGYFCLCSIPLVDHYYLPYWLLTLGISYFST